MIPNVFSRRGPASSDPRHRDGPSTPKARTRLQNMNARVPERGQSKRKAKLKQSQIDLSMVPAGASSSPQAELRGSHRPVVSSPIDLNDISSRSGEDDIVSATVTRRHLKKAPIAISSDDSDGNSGSKSPLNTQTEVKGPSSDPHANPERQRKCRLLDYHNESHFSSQGSRTPFCTWLILLDSELRDGPNKFEGHVNTT